MNSIAKLSGNDFDRMVLQGAFVDIEPKKVELIYGEIRFMNPACPVHDGQIEYLTNWSYENTARPEVSIRVQSSIHCGDHRPEPVLVKQLRIDQPLFQTLRPFRSRVGCIGTVSETVAGVGIDMKLTRHPLLLVLKIQLGHP